ncbi:hypothetical protein ACFFWD_00600 [Bradyrhizobium erythrophlei]|uniref:hypothetical protein n=1 Tax=Bradyrhizobium erythrophlei TaxID=1437360 RepID=UPI0035F07026
MPVYAAALECGGLSNSCWQIDSANYVFSPREEEIHAIRRILDAMKDANREGRRGRFLMVD